MNAPNGQILEWKRFWFLPVSAALGYATAVIHIYSIGPFIGPLQAEFGWSRAQVSSGVALAALISGLVAIPMGMLVDRIGPRRMALPGAVLVAGAYALLGTTSGGNLNWLALWTLIAICTFFVHATVWTSAVASRFEKSRGLALAITLSGGSLAAAIFPAMATWLIERYGWRAAFPLHAAAWLVLVLPILFFCFRGAQDDIVRARKQSAPAKILKGVSLAEGLRAPALYKLLLSGLLFAFTAVGTLVHFVPILTGKGAQPMEAAGIAALVGIFSIVGRIGTGTLLDRFPGHLIGTLACLPAVAASVLLLAWGDVPAMQMLAAILLGLTLGAEVDVVAYLASRHFGLRNFGSLYGTLVMALALGTSFGPFVAGAMYDRFLGYGEYLMLTIVMMVIASASLLSLGAPPDDFSPAGGSVDP